MHSVRKYPVMQCLLLQYCYNSSLWVPAYQMYQYWMPAALPFPLLLLYFSATSVTGPVILLHTASLAHEILPQYKFDNVLAMLT